MEADSRGFIYIDHHYPLQRNHLNKVIFNLYPELTEKLYKRLILESSGKYYITFEVSFLNSKGNFVEKTFKSDITECDYFDNIQSKVVASCNDIEHQIGEFSNKHKLDFFEVNICVMVTDVLV